MGLRSSPLIAGTYGFYMEVIYEEDHLKQWGVSQKPVSARDHVEETSRRVAKGPVSYFSFQVTTYQQSPFISATEICTWLQIWETQDMH